MSLLISVLVFYVFANHCHAVRVISPHDAPISDTMHKRFEIAQASGEETGEQSRKLVLHYSFDTKISEARKITDDSGFDNNGMMDLGALILEPKGSTCKSVAYLWDHDIRLPSTPFQHPPRLGITVSVWLKLEGSQAIRRIFSVRGLRFGSLSLTVNLDQIIWSHLHQKHENYFSVHASTQIPRNWFHLAASYNCSTGNAIIYINGSPLNLSTSVNATSFDVWGIDARIGGHMFNEPIKGFIDEFRIYSYALSSAEVEKLAGSCSFSTESSYSKRHRIEPSLEDEGSENQVDMQNEPEDDLFEDEELE